MVLPLTPEEEARRRTAIQDADCITCAAAALGIPTVTLHAYRKSRGLPLKGPCRSRGGQSPGTTPPAIVIADGIPPPTPREDLEHLLREERAHSARLAGALVQANRILEAALQAHQVRAAPPARPEVQRPRPSSLVPSVVLPKTINRPAPPADGLSLRQLSLLRLADESTGILTIADDAASRAACEGLVQRGLATWPNGDHDAGTLTLTERGRQRRGGALTESPAGADHAR